MSLATAVCRCIALILVVASGFSDAASQAIHVVVDDNYPPYSFRDGAGHVQGIIKDLWDLWQQRTGVAVNLDAMDWNRALTIMQRGDADVIDTLFETPERRQTYDFSAPYETIEVPIFFHKSIGGITDAASLRGFKVGVKDGNACIDFLAARGIGELQRYPSYETLVAASIRQEVRVLCIDKPPAVYLFNRAGAAEEFRYSQPLYVGQFHWAVAKGRGDLKHLVTEGFSRITERERQAIETRWLGQEVPLGQSALLVRQISYALAAGVLAIALLSAWTWSLRRRVAHRTRELSATLNSLQQSEKRFRSVFEQANDAIFIMDGNVVVDCNERAERMYSMRRDEIIGAVLMGAAPAVQADGRLSEEVVHEAVTAAMGGQPMVFEWRAQRPDGRPFDVEINLCRIEVGGELRLQAMVRDITERKQAIAEIQHLANYDALTQLPNRRLVQDRLRQVLASCARRHAVGAVLFIDLDNFKTLNDTRGHDAGDALLKEMGQRLRYCVRSADFVGRLGGDEFVVLIENLPGNEHEAAAQAKMVAHKLLATVESPFHLGTIEYHTTTSIGLCLFSGTSDETVDEILKRADAAMYRAKTAGRNTLSFFDPSMQASLEARAAMGGELRRALPDQQFRLYFQAQVDRRQRVVGAEVLLRWQHPERGLVAPGQFIPVAEESGLIIPIGKWVLETACQQLRAWNALAGLDGLRLAVNISARQFRQERFVDDVRDIVASSGIDPRNLILELTESLVLDDVAGAIAKMEALRQLGIGFALDDFGTGYSSLSYLKRLPLVELKIDQTFVRDIASDPSDDVIVRTIIVMARSLGLSVVAEGVETPVQKDFLHLHGCEYFQGYLFGRPLPGAAFEEMLQRDVAVGG